MSETTIAQELERSGRIAYTNTGVSMLPLIRAGRDVWIVEKKSPSEIRKYDVVLFRRPQAQGRHVYVLHRVLKLYPDGRFWIVGDNCISGEDVAPEDVLGVLTALKRDGKPYDLNSLGYRAYVRLWCAPWRLRFKLLWLKMYIPELLAAVKRRLGRK